jgi:hypothetical protein
MSANIYRHTAPPKLDAAEEERELLALGEKTGLFPDASRRRRAILSQLPSIAIGIAIMLKFGLNVTSLSLTFVSILTIATVITDPAARRRAVARAVREAPSIEPPLR